MININNIIHDSIVDGPGVRSVIFTQGCNHKCFNCHNEETWSLRERKLYSKENIVRLLEENNFSKKITISGGEPLLQYEEILLLCKKLKKLNYHIVLYTGYTFEYINNNKKEILNYIDILIDGLYIDELKDLSLLYRGSINQRIIYLLEGKEN